jgi:adenylate cyclase
MTDTQYEVTVAIVFADISGSTSLYERVGNTLAHEQISKCLELLRNTVAEHNGVFVHSRGDDVVCTFADPEDAFKTVRDMLARTDGGELLVHIGLDHGPVIRIRDDIFGDCVNAAARLSGLANANEALCSENMRAKLGGNAQTELQFFDTRHLKGKQSAANIYRYAKPNLDAGTQISFGVTVSIPAVMINLVEEPHALLTYDGRSLKCTASRTIIIGRVVPCDLIVAHNWVSRRHAVVEMRGDHAYLRDISSNGIYVCVADQAPVLLRRETMLLPANCSLSPTNHPNSPEAVFIECQVITPANTP